MDWNLVYVACGVALNALVLAVWKPWARGSGGENGRSLPCKQDIDEVYAEVRKIAASQKEIESHVSGDSWRERARWQQRRDIYGAILQELYELTMSYGEVKSALARRDAVSSEIKKLEISQQALKILDHVVEIRHKFSATIALAVIFCGNESNHLLKTYVASWSPAAREIPSRARVDGELESISTLTSNIIAAARRDLGIGNQLRDSSRMEARAGVA